MKKLLFLGLLLSGMSVYASDDDSDSGDEYSEILRMRREHAERLRANGLEDPRRARPAAPAAADDDDNFGVDMFAGPDALQEHSEALAVATASVKPTPPPVKPKPKVCKTCHTRPCTCSADAVPAAAAPARKPLRVKTEGEVQQKWKPGGATQAELDTLAAIGEQTAQDINAAQRPDTTGDAELAAQLAAQGEIDDELETQALIEAMIQADLERQRRKKEEFYDLSARSADMEERMAARRATQRAVEYDAALAQQLRERENFIEHRASLQIELNDTEALLKMEDLTTEERTGFQRQKKVIEEKIAELNRMIFSLGLE